MDEQLSQQVFNTNDLLEKLKSDDPRAVALILDFISHLKRKYSLTENRKIYHRVGQMYEAAGRLQEAKENYYTASRYAETEGDLVAQEMLLEQAHKLEGVID